VPNPVVTVAMPVYNGAATVDGAIRSLLWQTFPDWELFIIIDGSTDASSLICRRFLDPRIRIIEEPERKGLAARLNQCVALARSQYVARMDADDIAFPERFERQVEYLEAHPDVDLLGHGALLFKDNGQIIGSYPVAETHERICQRPWWGFPLAHPTWMGRREWFAQHRYNDRVYKGQDQELLLRTWQSSKFAGLPDCYLAYRMEKVSWTKSAIGRAFYCRSLFACIRDVQSAGRFMRGLCIHGLSLGRDLLWDVTGMSGQQSRRSFAVAPSRDVERWRQLQKQLREIS
jgi:glycosyltransferase involved in cell wall biosynthesis